MKASDDKMDKMDEMNKIDNHEKFERWKEADAAAQEIEIKNGKMSDKDLELAYGGGKDPEVNFAKKDPKSKKKKSKKGKKDRKADIQKKLEEEIKK